VDDAGPLQVAIKGVHKRVYPQITQITQI